MEWSISIVYLQKSKYLLYSSLHGDLNIWIYHLSRIIRKLQVAEEMLRNNFTSQFKASGNSFPLTRPKAEWQMLDIISILFWRTFQWICHAQISFSAAVLQTKRCGHSYKCLRVWNVGTGSDRLQATKWADLFRRPWTDKMVISKIVSWASFDHSTVFLLAGCEPS